MTLNPPPHSPNADSCIAFSIVPRRRNWVKVEEDVGGILVVAELRDARLRQTLNLVAVWRLPTFEPRPLRGA